MDVARHHEARKAFGDPGAEHVGIDAPARARHHERCNTLTELGIAHADDGGDLDAGVASQHLLDAGGKDVLAAGHDHVVGSS